MPLLDYVPGYATVKAATGHAVAPNPNTLRAADVSSNYNSHDDTTVFVWEPLGGVGHASIMIGAAPIHHDADGTGYYASWFPGGDGVGKKDLVTDVPKAATSFLSDCLSEGNQKGGHRLPEHQIRIPGLDTAAMKSTWDSLRTNVAIYNLLQTNCSTIAARILRSGMGAFDSVLYSYWAHCVYWTPNDVKKFAQLLAP